MSRGPIQWVIFILFVSVFVEQQITGQEDIDLNKKKAIIKDVVSNITRVNHVLTELIHNYEKLRNISIGPEKDSDVEGDNVPIENIAVVRSSKTNSSENESIERITEKGTVGRTAMFYSEENPDANNNSENSKEEAPKQESPSSKEDLTLRHKEKGKKSIHESKPIEKQATHKDETVEHDSSKNNSDEFGTENDSGYESDKNVKKERKVPVTSKTKAKPKLKPKVSSETRNLKDSSGDKKNKQMPKRSTTTPKSEISKLKNKEQKHDRSKEKKNLKDSTGKVKVGNVTHLENSGVHRPKKKLKRKKPSHHSIKEKSDDISSTDVTGIGGESKNENTKETVVVHKGITKRTTEQAITKSNSLKTSKKKSLKQKKHSRLIGRVGAEDESLREKEAGSSANDGGLTSLVYKEKDTKVKESSLESLEEEKHMLKEQAKTMVLRKAYGDACLKVVVRKCYKASTKAIKKPCKEYTCKGDLKSSFRGYAKTACLKEFKAYTPSTTLVLSKQPLVGTLTGLAQATLDNSQAADLSSTVTKQQGPGNIKERTEDDMTRNGYLAGACLPTGSRRSNRRMNNGTQLNILRDKFEEACQQISRSKCKNACAWAIDQACNTYDCKGGLRGQVKKECTNECKKNYRYSSSSSSDSSGSTGSSGSSSGSGSDDDDDDIIVIKDTVGTTVDDKMPYPTTSGNDKMPYPTTSDNQWLRSNATNDREAKKDDTRRHSSKSLKKPKSFQTREQSRKARTSRETDTDPSLDFEE